MGCDVSLVGHLFFIQIPLLWDVTYHWSVIGAHCFKGTFCHNFKGLWSSSAVSHPRRLEFLITNFISLKTCVYKIYLLFCKIFFSAVSCYITMKPPPNVSFVGAVNLNCNVGTAFNICNVGTVLNIWITEVEP